jgi:hypothetical protein
LKFTIDDVLPLGGFVIFEGATSIFQLHCQMPAPAFGELLDLGTATWRPTPTNKLPEGALHTPRSIRVQRRQREEWFLIAWIRGSSFAEVEGALRDRVAPFTVTMIVARIVGDGAGEHAISDGHRCTCLIQAELTTRFRLIQHSTETIKRQLFCQRGFNVFR